MTEHTSTITSGPDNCTVPNTQFNVQTGLRNQVITRHQPLCAVDQPDIAFLNGKPTNSINTNNTHITLILYTSCHLTSSLLTERKRVQAITEITTTQ